MATLSSAVRISTRHPKIVIGEGSLHRLEAIAEKALDRDPALAGRLLDELERAHIVKQNKIPAIAILWQQEQTHFQQYSAVELSQILLLLQRVLNWLK